MFYRLELLKSIYFPVWKRFVDVYESSCYVELNKSVISYATVFHWEWKTQALSDKKEIRNVGHMIHANRFGEFEEWCAGGLYLADIWMDG